MTGLILGRLVLRRAFPYQPDRPEGRNAAARATDRRRLPPTHGHPGTPGRPPASTIRAGHTHRLGSLSYGLRLLLAAPRHTPLIGPPTLYLIGGGAPTDPRMKWHYDAIVALAREAGSTRGVRLAVLPTARRNGTSPRLGHWDNISRQFAERGCEVIDILVGDVPAGQREMDRGEVEAILASVDLLFAPGGDTRYLLEILRSRDLEGIFRSAIEAGLVTAGSSAGTLWLAEKGMSDSESFTAQEPWEFIMVEGLAVLPYTINVHDDAGPGGGCASPRTRREQFEDRFLAEEPERPGLAIDEFAALEVRGHRGVVWSPSSGIGIDLLRRTEAGIERRRIEEIEVVPNFAG